MKYVIKKDGQYLDAGNTSFGSMADATIFSERSEERCHRCRLGYVRCQACRLGADVVELRTRATVFDRERIRVVDVVEGSFTRRGNVPPMILGLVQQYLLQGYCVDMELCEEVVVAHRDEVCA